MEKTKIKVIMLFSLLSAGCGIVIVETIPIISYVFLSMAIVGMVYLFFYFFEVGSKTKSRSKG